MGPGKYVYTREFTEDDNPKRFCRQDIVAQFRERVRYIIFLIDMINIDRIFDLINRQNQKGISIADVYFLTTLSPACLIIRF